MDHQLELIDCIQTHHQSEQDRINLAEANRDVGMALAVEHAEDVNAGWKDKAYRALLTFLHFNPGMLFQAEDIRLWAEVRGLPHPPNNRAWGAIIVKAKKANRIQFIRIEATSGPSAHRANASVWKAL